MAPGGLPVLRGQQVSWERLCSEALGQPVRSVKARAIARLWSGYGCVTELAATAEDGSVHRLVAKQVDPPPQRGQAVDVSHSRKIKSYAAEAGFYASHAARLLEPGAGACAAAIARPLLVDVSPPSHTLFVLTDLRTAFPSQRYSLDKQVRKVCVCMPVCACVCDCE